jgi:hypothetical protein
MEDVGIFYGHLVHFMVFCYILWTFGMIRGNLVYFSRFGILYQETSGNPGWSPFVPAHLICPIRFRHAVDVAPARCDASVFAPNFWSDF